MKNHEEGDLRLDRVLKNWQVNAPLPPRFQERVWQRIAAGERNTTSTGWSLVWKTIQAGLMRPQAAMGFVCLLLALGFALGWTRGIAKSARMEEALSARYVQVLDPYLNR